MPVLTNRDIETISDLLENNEPVRHQISGKGTLHIDRQLPFLVVYREPDKGIDPGTSRLLLGEAAYLIVRNGSDGQEELSNLVASIQKIQRNIFGGFLLLEIWAKPDVEAEHEAPEFCIFAPQLHCPKSLLEKFESALLQVSVNGKRAKVAIEYSDSIVPPYLKSLTENLPTDSPDLIHLGLEISPVYRSSTGTLFPFELRELHSELSRALKRLFYEFTHSRTTHRPRHYHELGRRAMTKAVFDTDQQLAAISSEFDLLLHVTPVNVPVAWQQFEQSRFQKVPEFLYRARPVDPGLVKRRLYDIPLEEIEDPTLAHIFIEKRDELDREITLLADRNTRRFLLGSRQLFGDVEQDLMSTAEDIVEKLPARNTEKSTSGSVSAQEFHNLAISELEHYQQQDSTFSAKVELRSDIYGVMVSHGNLLIDKSVRISRSRVNALLIHEMGTHMLTYHNGRHQPLQELSVGMAGYQPMQEGLAVLGEYLVGGLNPERIRLLAGRVIAVKSITEGSDFLDTFDLLHQQYGFDLKIAFQITVRVFRGGGYTKDVVYLRGLRQILSYLATGKDLEELYVGKISHDHLSFVQELKYRGILQPSRLRPRFPDTSQTRYRMQKLAKGLSVMDLVEDS